MLVKYIERVRSPCWIERRSHKRFENPKEVTVGELIFKIFLEFKCGLYADCALKDMRSVCVSDPRDDNVVASLPKIETRLQRQRFWEFSIEEHDLSLVGDNMFHQSSPIMIF